MIAGIYLLDTAKYYTLSCSLGKTHPPLYFASLNISCFCSIQHYINLVIQGMFLLCQAETVNPAAEGGNPFLPDIVFSLLIIHLYICI